MAKLVPYAPPIAPRTGGFLKGQVWEAPDCWEPDEALAAAMTDAPIFPESSDRKVAEDGPADRSRKP